MDNGRHPMNTHSSIPSCVFAHDDIFLQLEECLSASRDELAQLQSRISLLETAQLRSAAPTSPGLRNVNVELRLENEQVKRENERLWRLLEEREADLKDTEAYLSLMIGEKRELMQRTSVTPIRHLAAPPWSCKRAHSPSRDNAESDQLIPKRLKLDSASVSSRKSRNAFEALEMYGLSDSEEMQDVSPVSPKSGPAKGKPKRALPSDQEESSSAKKPRLDEGNDIGLSESEGAHTSGLTTRRPISPSLTSPMVSSISRRAISVQTHSASPSTVVTSKQLLVPTTPPAGAAASICEVSRATSKDVPASPPALEYNNSSTSSDSTSPLSVRDNDVQAGPFAVMSTPVRNRSPYLSPPAERTVPKGIQVMQVQQVGGERASFSGSTSASVPSLSSLTAWTLPNAAHDESRDGKTMSTSSATSLPNAPEPSQSLSSPVTAATAPTSVAGPDIANRQSCSSPSSGTSGAQEGTQFPTHDISPMMAAQPLAGISPQVPASPPGTMSTSIVAATTATESMESGSRSHAPSSPKPVSTPLTGPRNGSEQSQPLSSPSSGGSADGEIAQQPVATQDISPTMAPHPVAAATAPLTLTTLDNLKLPSTPPVPICNATATLEEG
ncbi:hypothetical protein CVT26_016031 [Gymnopilus dilepis]|uniref:Uncharacterized protein n=1 Tax=Gymnopilus dilepis TaxID=231916 RepID=A0A409YDV7_9AGAR|nr:hypothetical protein CVT26_016031 [Gymnopilus dilepis]